MRGTQIQWNDLVDGVAVALAVLAEPVFYCAHASPRCDAGRARRPRRRREAGLRLSQAVRPRRADPAASSSRSPRADGCARRRRRTCRRARAASASAPRASGLRRMSWLRASSVAIAPREALLASALPSPRRRASARDPRPGSADRRPARMARRRRRRAADRRTGRAQERRCSISTTSAMLTPRSRGDGRALGRAEPAEVTLHLAQVEEELALRLGRRDLHDAPVAQDELVHLGANPVHRERHETHADLGVEALDGLHEADVAFLDQVAERQAVTDIAARNVTTKRRCDSTSWRAASRSCSLRKRTRERPLLLQRQHGHRVYRVDVGIEAADRAQQGQFGTGDNGGRIGQRYPLLLISGRRF